MRILMVCLGNICRSPLAEALLHKKTEERGLDFHIDSCGTSSYHIGESPDARTQANAKTHGIDMSRLRARAFTINDFENFDIIFVMDNSNFRDVAAMARNAEDLAKVKLLLKETEEPGYPPEVPDPYYGGTDGFEQVYQLLSRSCDDFLNSIQNV